MFLTENELLDRLKLRIRDADQIDVAVAWANECDALDELKKYATRRPLRAIVGIAGNATHPNALRSLQGCGKLRIHDSDEGLFHPKLYIFYEGRKRHCWVGSANLTRGGFGQNTEVVFECEDIDGTVLAWFDDCWKSLGDDEANAARLEVYEERWEPPLRSPRTQLYSQAIEDDEGYFAEYVSHWDSFVAQLAEADLYWGTKKGWDFPITGETDSWLETISLGQRVARRDDWSTFSKEDAHILLGRGRYGQLGDMRGAGLANNVFRASTAANLRTRRTIRKALQPCIDAQDEQFPHAACEFIGTVSSLDGFGGAIATRFLALARPDVAISVNAGSSSRLAALTGLPESSLSKAPSGRGHSYFDLLHWFRQQEWYSNPQPRNAREKLYANARSALFDALVYDWGD